MTSDPHDFLKSIQNHGCRSMRKIMDPDPSKIMDSDSFKIMDSDPCKIMDSDPCKIMDSDPCTIINPDPSEIQIRILDMPYFLVLPN